MRSTVPLSLAVTVLAVFSLPSPGRAERQQPPAPDAAGAKPAGTDAPDDATAGRERVAKLLEDIGRSARETRSLTVVFAVRQWDSLLKQAEEFEGLLKVRRTHDGVVLARYDYKPVTKGAGPQAATGLLVGDDVYLLQPQDQTALRIPLGTSDKLRWLEKWFNPFVVFLNGERVRRDFRLDVTKEDQWYTYLAVTPRHPKRSGWLPDEMLQGGVAILNRGTGKIPAGAPRQLWYSNDSNQRVLEIREWKVNAPDGPEEKDFERPEKLPGWKTVALEGELIGEKAKGK
jgi:hypothetical protein